MTPPTRNDPLVAGAARRDAIASAATPSAPAAPDSGESLRPEEAGGRDEGETRRGRVAAVCYRRCEGVIEFLLVRSARGRWTLPACGSEPGETRWEAAERAAFEEAGATGRTDRRPLTTVLLDAGPWEEGGHPEVDAFLVHVERRHMPTGRDREPTWFAADEAERMLTADRRSYESAALRQLVWVACRGIVERSAPA